MKKQFFNYILLALLFVIGFSRDSTAQNIKVEAKLQDFTIKIGDQTKLFLVVQQPAKEHINFPRLVDTIIGKVQIVNANKPDTIFDKNDRNRVTVTQSYVITGFDAGTYNLPAFEFSMGTGVVKSNELTLQVQTVKVDTTKSIYDIKQPIKVTYTFFDWLKDYWLWIAAGVIAVALIIGLIYYLRNKPKVESIAKIVKPSIPIHIITINKLRELRAKKLWQQEEVKQYHIELTDIIREYLEQRYDIKTQEKTTDEILASLKSRDITTEYRNMLKRLLELADLVKFAKLKPLPVENEESMDSAIEFVVKTQQDNTPKPDNDNTREGSGNESV